MRPYVLHWLAHHVGAAVASLLAPSWFTCVGLAGVASLLVLVVLARRRGFDPAAIASLVAWCYVAAVVAGIAVPALIDGAGQLFATGEVHLHWSGMTSFWGYLAGAGAVIAICKRHRLPLAGIADLSVIPLGIALACARIGCFLAGCDYGKISSLPWAVRFPAGSPAWRDHVHSGLIRADRAQSLPVHPTQLYEALLGLVIVGIALVFARRRRRDGELFLVAAATYAVGRLAIEALRGDAGRGIHAGLSSGQIFSLLVLLAIAARWLVAQRRALAIATAVVIVAASRPGAALAEPVAEPVAAPDPTERPLFSTGLLFGAATPLNRRANQIAGLSGASLSIGYLPGRFGLWLDVDALSSREASHKTILGAVSFTQRPTRRLMLGARAGIGFTRVSFEDPAFRDVNAATYRLDAIVEYAVLRHWAVWLRPLTIDMITASELGGPITTYQVRVGVAYRFGSRRNAVRPPEPPPPLPQLGAVP
jgi:prolipoprotein diacylglyceryltransferase